MTPSNYQRAIYDWIRDGRGDAAVNAVAGSGKTTTLVEASKLLRTSNALFLAFNKSIVGELQTRLGAGVACKTLNSLGHGAVMRGIPRDRKLRLDDGKYRDIVSQMVGDYGLTGSRANDMTRAITTLVRFAQSSLCATDNDSLAALAERYDVDPVEGISDSELFEFVRRALDQGEQMGRLGIISFDDQIWLPVKWNLRPSQAEWVLVDECQDLSAAKLELALSARAPGGRMLFVGDARQAVYGFAGADADSWHKIVARTSATVLPLSVCYRCPTKVITLAQTIVPHIEAAPGADAGNVQEVCASDLAGIVRTGDLVICRLTAPLITLCVNLIVRRIPARVKGRDLARALISIAKEALGRMDYSDLPEALLGYLDHKSALLARRKNGEAQIQSLTDRVNGVRACVTAFPEAKSLSELSDSIDSLFTDGEAAVELSTVHRAKGLEADRVFILAPEKLPLVWAGQQAWETEQEQNLRYVALTRARRELYFVTEAPAKTTAPAAEKELALT
jgi:superfamily I DNA/RNA helicase